jgi:hypothetical protein
VHALGYRSVRLPGTVGDREVILEPGIRVTLITDDRRKWKQGNRTASLSLKIAEIVDGLPEGTHSVPLPRSIASEGSATVFFPCPGKYRLHISIREPASGGAVMATGDTPVKGVFFVEVRDEDDGATLAIPLPESFF